MIYDGLNCDGLILRGAEHDRQGSHHVIAENDGLCQRRYQEEGVYPLAWTAGEAATTAAMGESYRCAATFPQNLLGAIESGGFPHFKADF